MPAERDTPTPDVRLRKEVAEAAAKLSSHPPHLHDHTKPDVSDEDVRSLIKNFGIALSESFRTDISEHESAEQKMRDASDLATTEKLASMLNAHHDRLAETNKQNFHAEVQAAAAPFLQHFQEWQKSEGARITQIVTVVDDHEARLKAIEQLRGTVEKMQTEFTEAQKVLDEVKRRLDLIAPPTA